MFWRVCAPLCLVLAACGSPVGRLASLATGAPNVAANVQAGRTNAQTIGQTVVTEQRLTRPQARTIEQSAGRTSVRSEAVQTVVVREDPPPWLLLVALLGWLLPTPAQIGASVVAGFGRVIKMGPS
ncbi:bacteriophage spanin2 family protein [Leisingera sp. ANG-M7]|uniref:bacteriophage spanin2 family protein n=1 Tax=Leisingera sp. ANG-M7 TaxID=1577902 RepID=UPI000689E51A|nr:bacteriophage spanin2 family protein [Leisingera sp. ANG-M7]